MVYNASAEKRIYDLIEKSSQKSLSEGSVILNQALRALNQEFGTSHYGDLPEHDVERFKIRKKLYESIIGAYDKLVNNFIGNSDGIKKEKEDLEETVDELTHKINQLNEAQRAFKNL